MENNPVIRIRNLSKSYRNGKDTNLVLKGINLEIEPGRIIGYIGPNGAGKSTTVKIMCGLISAFEGTVEIGGFDIRKNPVEAKQMIGYVPETANLYDSVTPFEFFEFIVGMRQLETNKALIKAHKMMGLFEMEPYMNQRIGSFSKGMKQKVLIISALLHNPEIIFMDEPLTGLDANSVITVKNIIAQLASEGKTIFYSSHLMDIVEKVSDRIILIHHGEIVTDGSFESISYLNHDESLEKLFARLTGKQEETLSNLSEVIMQ